MQLLQVHHRTRSGLSALSVITLLALGPAVCGCGDVERNASSAAGDAVLDRATSLADTFVADHPAASLAWSWGEGVLMIGMMELARANGEPRFENYALEWLEFHREKGFRIFWSDSCPPGTVATLLIERRRRDDLGDIIDAVDEYLFELAPRTSDGGIAHLGFFPVLQQQLWVDSLFMFGEYLVRSARRTGAARALDLAAEQYEIFGARTQDPQSGLYVHSWDDVAQRNVPPISEQTFWARGNGWVLAAGFGLAATLGKEDARRVQILRRLAHQEAAILSAQDPSGLYWTVLNRPGETYMETAATGLLTYGLARGIGAGLASAGAPRAALLGMQGLLSRLRVEADGRYVLSGTSLGTLPGGFASYASVPTSDNVSYGVGAFLLAVAELVQLERSGAIDLRALMQRARADDRLARFGPPG